MLAGENCFGGLSNFSPFSPSSLFKTSKFWYDDFHVNVSASSSKPRSSHSCQGKTDVRDGRGITLVLRSSNFF